ncbi:MAG TPA: phytanoyl-CoA dioxygenase family protein [Myxococcota bacterium]|nr:phytanoyl-CoA dioxygenase family protein [Myxococcota bacterium]
MRTILSKFGRRHIGSADPAGAVAGAAAWREIILKQGLTADRARSLGDALEAEGRQLEAIEACMAANRLRRDPALERRLVRLRHAAFAQLDRSLSPAWPPFVPEDHSGAGGPPVVTPAELTPSVLRRGILRHGCVWVRGLVPPARVARLVETIDHAFDAHDACAKGGGNSPFFDPLDVIPNGEAMRGWVRDGQGILTADSPRALYEFLETVHELRLDELLHGFFGDRPALSAEKCTLRRVDNTPSYASWHQDGAFMGKGLRTVNVWFALSRCGRDAPGLDVIPRRLDHLLPTGGEGAIFDWAVSAQTIARELPGIPIWRPEFEAGDALLFDDLCLHRTAVDPGMTQLRYAIESWFFSSSAYPVDTQTPILV